MAKEDQDKPQDDFPETPQESTSFSEKDSFNTSSKKVNTDREKEKGEKDKCERQNIIINMPKEEKKWEKSHSIIGILVEVILIGITVWALMETRKSVKIANDALSDSRKKDSSADIRQARIDFLDSIVRERNYERDTSAYNLNKRSVQEQINSIREGQRQFDIDNRPYLQFEHFNIIFLDDQRKIKAEPNLANVGKQPVEILGHRTTIFYGRDTRLDTLGVQYQKNYAPSGLYVIKENPIQYPLESANPIEPELFNSIKKGETSVYFIGDIKYLNLITGKIRFYQFNIEVVKKTGDITTYRIHRNKNIDASKE